MKWIMTAIAGAVSTALIACPSLAVERRVAHDVDHGTFHRPPNFLNAVDGVSTQRTSDPPHPGCKTKQRLSALLDEIGHRAEIDVQLLNPDTDTLICTEPGSLPDADPQLRLRMVAHMTGHRIVWLAKNKARLRPFLSSERSRLFTRCPQPDRKSVAPLSTSEPSEPTSVRPSVSVEAVRPAKR